jgi:hypothetical protein
MLIPFSVFVFLMPGNYGYLGIIAVRGIKKKREKPLGDLAKGGTHGNRMGICGISADLAVAEGILDFAPLLCGSQGGGNPRLAGSDPLSREAFAAGSPGIRQ